MTVELWTVREAEGILDPPMDGRSIRWMITEMRIPEHGKRRTPGRSAMQYAASDLMQAHAIIMNARIRFAERRLDNP